jgi:hypothetical protein
MLVKSGNYLQSFFMFLSSALLLAVLTILADATRGVNKIPQRAPSSAPLLNKQDQVQRFQEKNCNMLNQSTNLKLALLFPNSRLRPILVSLIFVIFSDPSRPFTIFASFGRRLLGESATFSMFISPSASSDEQEDETSEAVLGFDRKLNNVAKKATHVKTTRVLER